MRERLVRFRHAVDVVLLLHRSAAAVDRIEQLADEPVFHHFLTAVPRVHHDPADRESGCGGPRDLERHLVGSTADTA